MRSSKKIFESLKAFRMRFKFNPRTAKQKNTNVLSSYDYRTLMVFPLLFLPRICKMEDQEEDEKLDIKDITRGEYENKIRTFSSIEKKFLVFANIKKYGETKMSYIQFLHSMVPFQYIKTKNIADVDKMLQENKDFSNIMKKIDINGDGFINFEEYILMCVFLTIPIQEFLKAFPKGSLTREELVEYVMDKINKDKSIKITSKSAVDARIVNTDYNTLYKLAVEFMTKSFQNPKVEVKKDIAQLKTEIYMLLLFYEVRVFKLITVL